MKMRKIVWMLAAVAAMGAAAADWREGLPRPVFDERPEFVEFYRAAWEIAHTRIDNIPGLPAPRYMDEAFRSDRIWIWDTCFMVLFCKYLPGEFPGVESLENFYGIMLADGNAPLPRVRGNEQCGKDAGKMLPFMIQHPDNPPLFAWAEYSHALQTGDRRRLEKVYLEERWLQRWYELFDAMSPDAPKPHGANVRVALRKRPDGYNWAGNPNGMDNTPRGRKGARARLDRPGKCPDNPRLLWLDALAQQGLSALCLSRIAELLGRGDEAAAWRGRWEVAREKMNALYWDDADGFYYDILDGDRSKVKVASIASFWPMLAEMPTREMASRLEEKLADESAFGGDVPLVSLARSDADFVATGGYWRGAVWLPTAYMAVKAVDAYGDFALARTLARRTLEHMFATWRRFEPHTIWECYSPTAPMPSDDPKSAEPFVRRDFCGWSALGPISLFVEDVIGVKQADAFAGTLLCDFAPEPAGRVGVENYRFGAVVCDIIATADEIRVTSNAAFTLVADGKRHAVQRGDNVFKRK